jgi:hypothetical protein
VARVAVPAEAANAQTANAETVASANTNFQLGLILSPLLSSVS